MKIIIYQCNANFGDMTVNYSNYNLVDFPLQVANWRMERLEVDSKSASEEEFFDCLGNILLVFELLLSVGVLFCYCVVCPVLCALDWMVMSEFSMN